MTTSRSEEFSVISSTESHHGFIDKTVDSLTEIINWTRCQLVIKRLDDKQIMSKLDLIEHSLIDLTYASTSYNFADIPINGFSACVDLFIQFFKNLQRIDYFTTAESIDNLELVIDLILTDISLLVEYHSKGLSNQSNGNKVGKLIREDDAIFERLFTAHDLDSHSMEILATNFNGFWINKASYRWVKLVELVLGFGYTSFPKCFKVLSSKKFRRSAFHQCLINSSAKSLLEVMRNIDNHIIRKIFRGILTRDARVTSSTFYVERQGRWTVASQGRNVIKSVPEISNKLPLRFRFHKHKKSEKPCDTLIFYCHGGGFVISQPELHENYQRKWVGDLENVSLLCLDYSLQVPYPIVFQEFLDAYLWVTSGSQDVVDKIGFHPKKIIISGDSAGGVIGMALLSCLALIEAQDSSLSILYPNDLVFFYGAFMCTGYLAPSRFLAFYDVIISAQLLGIMMGCIIGIQGVKMPKPRPPNRVVRGLKYFHEDCKRFKTLVRPNKEAPWYKSGNKYNVNLLESIWSLRDTYCNSLADFDFDKFSNIRLNLITTNRCFFLDDNIELAKTWKGPIELHVIKGYIHGFLYIPEEREAIQFGMNIFKKITQA